MNWNWICRSSIRHPTVWKWKQTLEEECNNRKGELGQKSVIETSEEEELEICSSSGRRRRRIRGIHERAPRKLLIAESSNSSRLATLHYSHFIQQLLLPPPITNTQIHWDTHTRRLSHFQHHHSPFHCLHFTCRTSLKHGIREFCWQEENLQDAFSKLCAACRTCTPWCSASFSRAPFHSERPQDSGGLCALSHQDLVRVHALLQGLAEIRVNKQHIVTPPTLPGSGKKGPGSTERKHSGLQRRRFSSGQITFGTKWEKDLCRFERN